MFWIWIVSGSQGSRASLSSPVSCSQSDILAELEAAAPLSGSCVSLDHADCSDTEITSPATGRLLFQPQVCSSTSSTYLPQVDLSITIDTPSPHLLQGNLFKPQTNLQITFVGRLTQIAGTASNHLPPLGLFNPQIYLYFTHHRKIYSYHRNFSIHLPQMYISKPQTHVHFHMYTG